MLRWNAFSLMVFSTLRLQSVHFMPRYKRSLLICFSWLYLNCCFLLLRKCSSSVINYSLRRSLHLTNQSHFRKLWRKQKLPGPTIALWRLNLLLLLSMFSQHKLLTRFVGISIYHLMIMNDETRMNFSCKRSLRLWFFGLISWSEWPTPFVSLYFFNFS